MSTEKEYLLQLDFELKNVQCTCFLVVPHSKYRKLLSILKHNNIKLECYASKPPIEIYGTAFDSKKLLQEIYVTKDLQKVEAFKTVFGNSFEHDDNPLKKLFDEINENYRDEDDSTLKFVSSTDDYSVTLKFDNSNIYVKTTGDDEQEFIVNKESKSDIKEFSEDDFEFPNVDDKTAVANLKNYLFDKFDTSVLQTPTTELFDTIIINYLCFGIKYSNATIVVDDDKNKWINEDNNIKIQFPNTGTGFADFDFTAASKNLINS